MMPLVWMTVVCVGCAAVAVAAGVPAAEVLWGMAGPLVAANVTWVIVSRTYKRSPDRFMGVMLKAFAGKVVFFGAYAVLMLRGLALGAMPFAFSFAAFFIGVYAMEALFLQRLVTGTR
jgi:hypothetical protein